MNSIDGLSFEELAIEPGETTIASRVVEVATGEVLARLVTTPVDASGAGDFF